MGGGGELASRCLLLCVMSEDLARSSFEGLMARAEHSLSPSSLLDEQGMQPYKLVAPSWGPYVPLGQGRQMYTAAAGDDDDGQSFLVRRATCVNLTMEELEEVGSTCAGTVGIRSVFDRLL